MDETFYHNDPELKARHERINPLLEKAGWKIRHYKDADVHSHKGVAVEFFETGRGFQADYVLFVNGKASGIIEAKKGGETLAGKELQSAKYSREFPEEFEKLELPLPFLYESSGTETFFTNLLDPKPRSREVFAFHRPETIEEWANKGRDGNLRRRLAKNVPYENDSLWEVQRKAIDNVKRSLAAGRPKSLIQMATGSGKTFTSVNLCYDLIKNAGAKRILFLVDRGNLGKQTRQEFENFVVPEDGRKFTELYNVQHMTSNKIEDVSKVCISTIQRMYSILKGEKKFNPESEESLDYNEDNEHEPIEYNEKVPIEEFDFLIVDECHRSIYNLWKRVPDYFDPFIIGLTATPSKGTIAFFDSNLVMEYGHERAVADQVNVDFTVFNIRTAITDRGSRISKGETIAKRDRRTRQKRWETLQDEIEYGPTQLDKAVVSKDQIRKIIRTFRENVFTKIFKGRKHVPKTLIYAKDDNHAEEIVRMVREEFNEGNDFAVKITYKTEGEKTENLIRQFRNEMNPRIAVTVDMISTGTDIKPLEIVFFMRSVKSRMQFEQMKGRGVRVMKNDDFKSVTPDAMAKERFVIIDAVGVCENEDLNETRPLEQCRKMSFEKLLRRLQYGRSKREYLSSMASRLSRLQKRLTEKQNEEIKKIAGRSLKEISAEFISAIDEDAILAEARKAFGESPKESEIEEIAVGRMREAARSLTGNGELMRRLPEIRKETEQIIDSVSHDKVEEAGFSRIAEDKARGHIRSFRKFIEENRDELHAIQIIYKNKGKIKWRDIKELSKKIVLPPYSLTTEKLWVAYEQAKDGKVRGSTNNKKIVDFISLMRHEIEKTDELEPYLNTVNKRFAEWLATQKENGASFNQEQLKWLKLIRNHISTTADIQQDDFDSGNLQKAGGLGRAVQVFGQKKIQEIISQMNEKVGG